MSNNVLPDPLNVKVVSPIFPKTAFGELSVAQPTPVVQMAANYGLLEKAFTFTSGSATTVAEDSLFKASTSANTDETATILTDKQLTYRPGQGAACRLTAIFSPGATGNEQQAGLITATDVFAFGYNGDEFGILHAHDGVLEIQELTITTSAGGAENATVTVDAVPYVVPLTVGTLAHNAIEIAESLNVQVNSHVFSADDDQVVAMAIQPGPNGAFAFTSATAVAAWVQQVAGVDIISDWTPQASWNGAAFPSLDPQLGNVYEIKFQYLGFGGISFFVEDPESTELVLAHMIQYANSHVSPSVTNPTFRCGWLSTNTTNNTAIEVSGASVGGFVEGEIVLTEDPRSLAATVPAVGTALNVNMLTIRNRLVFGSQRNRAAIFTIKASALTESNKGAILEIRKNALVTGDLIFSYIDKATSITEFAINDGIINTGAVASGRLIDSLPVSTSGIEVDLSQLAVDLQPSETLTVSMRTISGAAADSAATISFREDL